MRYIFLLCAIFFLFQTSCDQVVRTDKRILVYTRNGEGYIHDNIEKGTVVILFNKILNIGNYCFVIDIKHYPALTFEIWCSKGP